MTIMLYKTPDDPNVAEKQLTPLQTVNGTARKKEQIGTLTLDLTIAVSDINIVNECNYLYVEELGRYYWTSDAKSVVNGIWEANGCTVDPLMSHRAELLECEGVVSRWGSSGDKYLQDPVDQQYQNPHITYTPFPSSFSGTKSLILVTC